MTKRPIFWRVPIVMLSLTMLGAYVYSVADEPRQQVNRPRQANEPSKPAIMGGSKSRAVFAPDLKTVQQPQVKSTPAKYAEAMEDLKAAERVAKKYPKAITKTELDELREECTKLETQLLAEKRDRGPVSVEANNRAERPSTDLMLGPKSAPIFTESRPTKPSVPPSPYTGKPNAEKALPRTTIQAQSKTRVIDPPRRNREESVQLPAYNGGER